MRSPILLDILAKNSLNDFSGITALGILIIAKVPKPIINSTRINKNVIKPTKFDLITFIFLNLSPKNHLNSHIFQYEILRFQIFVQLPWLFLKRNQYHTHQ